MNIDISTGLAIVMMNPNKGTSDVNVFLDGEQVGFLAEFEMKANKDAHFPEMRFQFRDVRDLKTGQSLEDLQKKISAWVKRLSSIPNTTVVFSPSSNLGL